MNTVIFSTAFDSYNIMHIIYAGAVQEIPQEKRKNDISHFFRILTRQGVAFCYFKGGESARKARVILETMMESAKPNKLFRSGSELIDVESVISYGRIVKLKNSEDGKTHAFTVILNTVSERNNQVSFSFKSEESAKKARAVLWSIMESLYGGKVNHSSEEKNDMEDAEVPISP
jgi:uncharacterized protein YggL (DUF469 family)